MADPADILDAALQRAIANLGHSLLADTAMQSRVEFVARNLRNRAGVRLLLSCLLAKLHRPEVDLRKPYTEIGPPDSFSGRSYDERYITPFINQHELPCNATTAFLTPALRNRNTTLTPDLNLVGSPPQLYQFVLLLLDDVHAQRVPAEDLLAETLR
jgi:DNA adenine methylase